MQTNLIYDSTPRFVHFAYKFTGKERDSESGLDYFGARHYSSTMGHFMSPDWNDAPEAVPYADLRNPQSLNLYAYVNNNPLTEMDEDGHDGAAPTATCGSVLCYVLHFLKKLGGPGSGPAPGSGPGDYWPNDYGRQVVQGVGARAQGAAAPIAGGAIVATAVVGGPVSMVDSAGSGVSVELLHLRSAEQLKTMMGPQQTALLRQLIGQDLAGATRALENATIPALLH